MLDAECEVRGAISLKASAYQIQLADGQGGDLPFDTVIQCDIGNPHRLGQASRDDT